MAPRQPYAETVTTSTDSAIPRLPLDPELRHDVSNRMFLKALALIAGAFVVLCIIFSFEASILDGPPKCVINEGFMYCHHDCASPRPEDPAKIWSEIHPGGPVYELMYPRITGAPVERYCPSDGEWSVMEKARDLKKDMEELERSKKGLSTVRPPLETFVSDNGRRYM